MSIRVAVIGASNGKEKLDGVAQQRRDSPLRDAPIFVLQKGLSLLLQRGGKSPESAFGKNLHYWGRGIGFSWEKRKFRTQIVFDPLPRCKGMADQKHFQKKEVS